MNTRFLLATVVVTMFVCQQLRAQAVDDPVMPEATEMEGTWEMVSSMTGGRQNDSEGRFVRFEGNGMYWRGGGNETWVASRFFSVDSSTMPTEIEFDMSPGIYEIDGEIMRICVAYGTMRDAAIRPDRFESPEDSRIILLVFRRVEEEESE